MNHLRPAGVSCLLLGVLGLFGCLGFFSLLCLVELSLLLVKLSERAEIGNELAEEGLGVGGYALDCFRVSTC